jgi:hypothetical protein
MSTRLASRRIVLPLLALCIALGMMAYARASSQNRQYLPAISYSDNPTATSGQPSATVEQPSATLEQPTATTAQGSATFKSYIKYCMPMHWHMQADLLIMPAEEAGFLGQNNVPGGPYTAVASHTPDGAPVVSGSLWSHQLILAPDPVAADWYFWVVDGSGQRVSEIASVQTDGEPGLGKCQDVGVVFYTSNYTGSGVPTPHPAPTAAPTATP